MKKCWPAVFIVSYPYSVVLLNSCLLPITFISICAMFLLPLVPGYLYAIYLIVCAKKKGWDLKGITKTNMVIRVSHIPAYVWIFVFAISTMWHFGLLFVVAGLVLCVLTIHLNGTFGVAALVTCYNHGLISKKRAIIYGVLQYIFCVGIVIAGEVFAIVKEASNEEFAGNCNITSEQDQSKSEQNCDISKVD